jgi:hypothetical protein
MTEAIFQGASRETLTNISCCPILWKESKYKNKISIFSQALETTESMHKVFLGHFDKVGKKKTNPK